jgi:hypothetical protein
MARKSKGPEMPAPVETDTSEERVVRLTLPPASHRTLRLLSAYADMSMAEYIRDYVIKGLEQEAKARGIKD